MIGESSRTVRVDLLEDGRLLRLVLDAGQGNVIGSRVIAELSEALRRHGAHPRLRAWILDHAGPHFSFGASVEEHAPERVGALLSAFHTLLREIVFSDLPFLACVRGACLGGGLELVLPADRVFAAPSARFAQPEVKLGVFAPAGSALLPRLVGPQRAADLLLSGRTIGAQEALAIGLVASIDEDPGAAALRWAGEHLLPKSATALRHATAALRHELREGLPSALEAAEKLYLGPLMATRDAREGLAAFLEKRDPAWEERG